MSNRITHRLYVLLCIGLLSACGSVAIDAQPTTSLPPTTPILPSAVSAAPTPPPASPTPPPASPTPPPASPTPPPASPTPPSSAVPSATSAPTSEPSPVLPSPSPAPVLDEAQLAALYSFPVVAARYSYGQYHHDYPATDIFCPIGSLFVAPTSGIVDHVSRTDSWNPAVNDPATRGGLSVAIIGDDGVRYYGSHLSTVEQGIEPGLRVLSGQILGLTGKSGNAITTEPHIHFGISRPTTPDDWAVRRGEISPYPYLQAWERGELARPVLP